MSRRFMRVAVQLPDLAPAQAQLLWELFEELANQIWLAYEIELCDFEAERFHAIADQDEGAADCETTSDNTPQTKLNGDPDPDF